MKMLTKYTKNKLCIKLVFFLHEYIEMHCQHDIKKVVASLYQPGTVKFARYIYTNCDFSLRVSILSIVLSEVIQ